MNLTAEKVQELLEATQAYQAAQRKLAAVCRDVGALAPAGSDARPAAQAERPARRAQRDGRRAAKLRSVKDDSGAAKPTGEKMKWRPKERVVCAVCMKEIKGSRRIGPHVYPYRHTNAAGEPCSGCDKDVHTVLTGA